MLFRSGFYSLIYHTKKFDDADREYQVTHGELVRNMSNDYEHDESWMDVVDAIHRVVLQLASAIPSERNIIDARGVGELERKCIASLPVHDFVLWTR